MIASRYAVACSGDVSERSRQRKGVTSSVAITGDDDSNPLDTVCQVHDCRLFVVHDVQGLSDRVPPANLYSRGSQLVYPVNVGLLDSLLCARHVSLQLLSTT